MLQDSLRAIQLDSQYFKAYVCNGEAYIFIGLKELNLAFCDKAIERFRQAFRLCCEQKFDIKIVSEIETQIRNAQNIRNKLNEKLINEEKKKL